jgi:hypothetical protein
MHRASPYEFAPWRYRSLGSQIYLRRLENALTHF